MKILVVYATHTGSTLYAAREIVGVLSDRHEVLLKTAAETGLEDLNQAEAVLVGSSSWDWQGNRGYPLHEMMDFLDRVKEFDFSTKKMALFGCGDRDFEHFCGALDQIATRLMEKGAMFVTDHLRLNRYFMDEVGNQDLARAWAGEVSQKLV